MQAILKMIRFLWEVAYRGAIVYLIFMLIAWVLLGMHPKENWAITTERVGTVWHKVTGFTSDAKTAAAGLSQMGEKHFKDAQDRYHGIDPYEKYNKQLDQINQ